MSQTRLNWHLWASLTSSRPACLGGPVVVPSRCGARVPARPLIEAVPTMSKPPTRIPEAARKDLQNHFQVFQFGLNDKLPRRGRDPRLDSILDKSSTVSPVPEQKHSTGKVQTYQVQQDEVLRYHQMKLAGVGEEVISASLPRRLKPASHARRTSPRAERQKH